MNNVLRNTASIALYLGSGTVRVGSLGSISSVSTPSLAAASALACLAWMSAIEIVWTLEVTLAKAFFCRKLEQQKS